MYCTQCGKELGSDGKCHNPSCTTNSNHLGNSQDSENFNINNNYTKINETPYNQHNKLNISIKDFASFIGPKNTEYYMDKLQKYEANQSFASWNWAAFFLTLYWMLYRKMYKHAAIVIAIRVASFFILGKSTLLVTLAISIGIGVYGNLFYMKDCINKISKVKRFSSNLSESDYNNRLIFTGGTNIAAPLILIGIFVFIVFFIFLSVGMFALNLISYLKI